MSATEFDVYCIYSTLKLHFQRDYFDAVKYRFKMKACTQDNFMQFKGRYACARIARQYETRDKLIALFSSELVRRNKAFVTEFTREPDHYGLALSYMSDEKVLLRDLVGLMSDPDFPSLVKSGFYFDEVCKDFEGEGGKLSFELVTNLKLIAPEVYEKIMASADIALLREELEPKISKYAQIFALNNVDRNKSIRKQLISTMNNRTTEN